MCRTRYYHYYRVRPEVLFKTHFTDTSAKLFAQMCRAVSQRPQASEAGACRGSDTPTMYVGDIDMYIP